MIRTSLPMRGAFLSRTAMAMALAIGVAGSVLLATAPAAAKDAPKDNKSANSREFATAAGPLQKTLADAQPLIKTYTSAATDADKATAMAALRTAFTNAPVQLAAAEAAIKTPGDRNLAGQWGNTVGAVLGDEKLMLHAAQNVLDAGLFDAAEAPKYQYKVGSLAYSTGDYALAVKTMTPAVAANFNDDTAAEILAVSYVNLNQPAQGLDALKTALTVRKAAGGVAPQRWFTRAAQIAYKANLTAQGSEWALLAVQNAPTPLNWLGSSQLVRIYNNYGSQDSLDVSRLMFRTGGLAGNSKEIQQEYLEYLQAADARRLPGEVLSVINAGVAAGAISMSQTFVAEAKNIASARIAGDKASLPGLEKDARLPSAALATLSGAGDAFLSYGEAAKAAEFYKLALAKPGVNVPVMQTRLGIAQVDMGDYAGAQASFAKVEGPRKPLAQLWTIYAQQKAGAK